VGQLARESCKIGNNMDLNLLDVFVKVCEHGSFTDAATAMELQRSAVSRRISALEKDLGVQLFHRSTRRVQLTSSGEQLRNRLAPLLSAVDNAVTTLPERLEVPSGNLAVSVATDVAVHTLVPFLAEFRARYPAVGVQLRVTNRRVQLEQEGVDVALRPALGPLEDTDLVARPLMEMGVGVFASPTYLAIAAKLEGIDDLPAHPMVTIAGLKRRSDMPLGPEVIAADDMSVVKACVVAGIGLGWLPHHMTLSDLESGRLVRVLPELEIKDVQLLALYPQAMRAIPKVRVFVDELARFLAR